MPRGTPGYGVPPEPPEPDSDETCPKCEGTGVVWSDAYGDWIPCRRCEGTGSIEVTP